MQEVVAAINLSSGQMRAGVLSQPIHSFSPFSLCFLGRPLVQMACFKIGFVDLIQSSSVKFGFSGEHRGHQQPYSAQVPYLSWLSFPLVTLGVVPAWTWCLSPFHCSSHCDPFSWMFPVFCINTLHRCSLVWLQVGRFARSFCACLHRNSISLRLKHRNHCWLLYWYFWDFSWGLVFMLPIMTAWFF